MPHDSKMEFSKRIVTEIPMKVLWDQSGDIEAFRVGYLGLNDLKALIKTNPLEFIVANVGDTLRRIPADQCYAFWKSEVKNHLINNPARQIRLSDYPDEYAYLASEWSGQIETTIILLETYH